jgi:hypothetical protein
MKNQRRYTASRTKRRTTLTLPADSLVRAERTARARKVNLSTVVAEALSDGLRAHTAAERSEEVLSAYKRAFTGFSPAEMAVLDGILLEPAKRQ